LAAATVPEEPVQAAAAPQNRPRAAGTRYLRAVRDTGGGCVVPAVVFDAEAASKSVGSCRERETAADLSLICVVGGIGGVDARPVHPGPSLITDAARSVEVLKGVWNSVADDLASPIAPGVPGNAEAAVQRLRLSVRVRNKLAVDFALDSVPEKALQTVAGSCVTVGDCVGKVCADQLALGANEGHHSQSEDNL
jgi:hypothetical protein